MTTSTHESDASVKAALALCSLWQWVKAEAEHFDGPMPDDFIIELVEQAMTARTTSQRQADYIANKQRQGLKQIRNLWAKPEDHAKVREFVARLNSA